jgi:hypothetical protein
MSTTPTQIALRDASGNAIVDSLGRMVVIAGPSVGTFRFLEDHTIAEEYIYAGSVLTMYFPWVPTPNVEPLDTTAVQSFYSVGPVLPSLIRSERIGFEYRPFTLPKTFWKEISPNVYALTGLGSNQFQFPPIPIRIGSPP